MPRYIDAEQFEGMLIVKPVVVEIKLNKLYATRDFTRQDFVKKAVVDDIPTADVLRANEKCIHIFTDICIAHFVAR